MSGEIYRDGWGIPHLRGADLAGVTHLQGRVAAHDRAWQLEVERHRSLGTSAAFLGPSALDWDRFARQARLDDTAQRCFGSLDGPTQDWLGAYADGVNAGLARGAARAPEFAATGAQPGTWHPWTPLSVWLGLHVLFTSFPTKLWRERVAADLGEDALRAFAGEASAGTGSSGSNGWLVAGERTTTGLPVIAGDPHRMIEDPGVYQQVRLACAEFDVVGLAVPGVPGIAHFGHAGPVAWAITNAAADYQDLYAEQLRRRGDVTEALGPDGWRPARSSVETIEVAGHEPVAVEIIETERGPVVIGGPDAERAVSLRYPSRVESLLGFEAIPALLRARTVADVDRAFERWVEPVNVVMAADVHGGLLHRTAGRVPRRHAANSRNIVPGWDSAHAWQGWHDPMPSAKVEGVAVMANERGLATPLGVEFAAPYRARRIRDLLDTTTTWSSAAMPSIHTDTLLGSAPALLALLSTVGEVVDETVDETERGLTPRADALRQRLLAWDRRMDADSTDAAAFAAWRAELVGRLAAHPSFAGLERPSDAPLFDPWLAVAPRLGAALGALLGSDLLPTLVPGLHTPGLLADALDAAAATLAAAAEPPTWGSLHRLAARHATAPPGPAAVPQAAYQPGSAPGPDDTPGLDRPLAGDHDCVLSTSSVPGVTDHCQRGPVARYVWDLADRRRSLWAVPLGASGVPGDPHHHDQLDLWRVGDLVPVITDWDQLTEEPV